MKNILNNKIKIALVLTTLSIALIGCNKNNITSTNVSNVEKPVTNSTLDKTVKIESTSEATTESKPVDNQQEPTLANYEINVNIPKDAFLKAYPNGKIKSISYHYDHGTNVYKVFGFSGSVKHKYIINAQTLEVVEEFSKDIGVTKNIAPIDFTDLMDLESAKKKALQDLGKAGEITEWKLSTDHGKTEYEFEIIVGSEDYEVTLNAKTGQLIEIDN